MKEKPIIFSAASVAAIQRGDKTQTRRVIKPQPPAAYNRCLHDQERAWWHSDEEAYWPDDDVGRLFRYQVGDRLYVKERWRLRHWGDDVSVGIEYAEGDIVTFDIPETADERWEKWVDKQVFWIGDEQAKVDFVEGYFGSYRSPIFMPKWISRLKMDVTGVKAEKLQDIMGTDGVQAEGYKFLNTDEGFVQAWNELNGKKTGSAWHDNPWVWVTEFHRIEAAHMARRK